MSEITRREFLRSAGGVTFLALTPIGAGLFAATESDLPKFSALPYIQPGKSSLLRDGSESIVVAWQTEAVDERFTLEYGLAKSYGSKAKIVRTERRQASPGPNGCFDYTTQLTACGHPRRARCKQSNQRYNYAAELGSLKLSTTYYYRLSARGQTIAEGYFATRKKRGEPVRFVAFGDNAHGDPGELAVAYYTYQAKPDLIVNTGDNVYEGGLDSQYIEYFYPIYNADVADPKVGAPLLRSVPFYTVLANHDVQDKDHNGMPVADFDESPDGLAYYTAMHLPLNGPAPHPTPMQGNKDVIHEFTQCAGERYPRMANYSFDYGDIHFLCLDSNHYADLTDAALQGWMANDLKSTDAVWKIVVAHHPAFNAGDKHYREQQMRVLSPLFEAQGVDFCLYGHEHTYQRTMPLKFAPAGASPSSGKGHEDRRIPGVFTVDRTFDGVTNTRPDGIIHVITGAGGKELYDPGYDTQPEKWLHPDDNNTAYVARFFSSLHSLTVFDVEGKTLTMSQIDEAGREVDRITVSKA